MLSSVASSGAQSGSIKSIIWRAIARERARAQERESTHRGRISGCPKQTRSTVGTKRADYAAARVRIRC